MWFSRKSKAPRHAENEKITNSNSDLNNNNGLDNNRQPQMVGNTRSKDEIHYDIFEYTPKGESLRNLALNGEKGSTPIPVSICKIEDLVLLVKAWEKSKLDMIDKAEALLNSKAPDSFKVEAIESYLKGFRRSLDLRSALEIVRSLNQKPEKDQSIEIPSAILDSVLASISSNYKLQNSEKLQRLLDSFKTQDAVDSPRDVLSTMTIKSSQDRCSSQGLGVYSINRTKNIVERSNSNAALVCKLGNYWRSPDNQSCLMISRIMNGSLSQKEIVNFLATQLQGRYNIIKTPFGDKLRLYADYTASGQELAFFSGTIESIVENYANTHTEASYDGKFMNRLLHEAELKILKGCNADPCTHTVLPFGTGATGSIEIVQMIFGTYIPPCAIKSINKVQSWDKIKQKLRNKKELPLVLVTAYEHHSNEITWRSQLCDTQVVNLGHDGFMDFEDFEKRLKSAVKSYKKIICSFSAGSNVTGILTDIDRVVGIAKKYKSIVCFDYAGCGPYTTIDMSKDIDAIYISPHKFIGGPGSSGIAIIKNRIYDPTINPTHGGGGTVDFVSQKEVVYSRSIGAREKSGTPGVLQIIRAGLVFDLKSRISEYIETREHELITRFFKKFGNDTRIYIFGPHEPDKRVPIISFDIKHIGPQGQRYLHPVFVIRLLSDVFGIQGRGGCSCAGPYGHELLHIDPKHSLRLKQWIIPNSEEDIGFEGIKFGWARINLHFCFTDEEFDYIMKAIDFVAEHGHLFLPFYVFNPVTGVWTHVKEESIENDILSFELFKTPKLYAKDEAARIQLFKKQLEDANRMLYNLNPYFSFDALTEWEDLAQHYVARGNVQSKESITQWKSFKSLNLNR